MTETFVGTAEEIRDEQNRIVLEVLQSGAGVVILGESKGGMSALSSAIKVDLAEIEREKERKLEVKEVVKIVKEMNQPRPSTIISNPKIGRNQPCPCGSGEKFKKCCRNKIDRRFLWNNSESLKLT